MDTKATFKAGAAQVDISPQDSQFLFGYPHVKRYSTGIHDPLWSSSLYLSNGISQAMFIANDIIFISKDLAAAVRRQVSQKTPLTPDSIMITATHTHSGPITVDYLSNEADPVVPKADAKYLAFLQERIIQSAVLAYQNAQPAQIGFALADDTGVGTNRRDPAGPADHQVPVVCVRRQTDKKMIACMLVCSMHPTVLHEDSTLVSGDFPGLARRYLQGQVFGQDCVILHHTGPCGNQSPRHVTKANTFQEAQRLGEILGKAVQKAVADISFVDQITLTVKQILLDNLPRRTFPTIEQAQQMLDKAIQKLKLLQSSQAPKQQIRTAECDWFGAEETLTLAKAAADGRLEKAYQSCLPAEIQVIRINDWAFVGWPGEIFVEYALEVKRQRPNTFIISLANGELQGYVVTEQAAQEGGYEASNALFDWQTGQIFVQKTLELLQ